MSRKSYWISKYALSHGIQAADGEMCHFNPKYIDVPGWIISFKAGVEIHETEAAAKAAAESMRLKKIASLKKQIAKLEAMKF